LSSKVEGSNGREVIILHSNICCAATVDCGAGVGQQRHMRGLSSVILLGWFVGLVVGWLDERLHRNWSQNSLGLWGKGRGRLISGAEPQCLVLFTSPTNASNDVLSEDNPYSLYPYPPELAEISGSES